MMFHSRFILGGLLILLVVMAKIWYNTNIIELQKIFDQSEVYSQEEQRRNITYQGIYTILRPTNQAAAWSLVVFHIRPLQPGNKLMIGRTTFRGEVTHMNEILVLNIRHIGNDIYTTEFIPSFEGEYTIKVVIAFVNGEQFNHTSHVTARMVPIEGSPFRISVDSRRPPEGITRYCSQSESGTAPGRWVRCGSLRNIEKCGAWQLNEKYDFDGIHQFFWLPYPCQLHHYTDFEMKTCFARNGWENIVLTGDSHTRFRAYHWATRLYGKCENCSKTEMTRFDLVPKLEWVFDARATRWPATFPSVKRPNEIYIHPKNRRSLFSYVLPKTVENGDLYLMNFGHWLLRVMKLERFMAHKLDAHLAAVKLMNISKNVNLISSGNVKKQKRFLWVNTMSLTWREDEFIKEWRMTPSPSTIAYVNSIIDTVIEKAGIQIVDAFQVSNARLRASFDSTHYAKMFQDKTCAGVVENAVTNVILNALCNVSAD